MTAIVIVTYVLSYTMYMLDYPMLHAHSSHINLLTKDS